MRFARAFFELSIDAKRDHGIAEHAYRRAFPSSQFSEKRAKTFERNPRVREMIEYLRAELARESLVPAMRVAREIEKVAFANVLDFGRVENGQFVLDLSMIDAAMAAVIQEVTTVEIATDQGVRRNTKLKFHSKMDALDKLAKIHGLFMDKSGLTVDDVDRLIAAMERRLGGPPPAVIEHEPL